MGMYVGMNACVRVRLYPEIISKYYSEKKLQAYIYIKNRLFDEL